MPDLLSIIGWLPKQVNRSDLFSIYISLLRIGIRFVKAICHALLGRRNKCEKLFL